MAETKHTSGPWEIKETNWGFEVVTPPVGWLFELHDGRKEDDKIKDPGFIEEQEANARLIAASPDLLEVAILEEALNTNYKEGRAILMAHGWNELDRFDISATDFVAKKRKAAIAKAMGKAA